MRTGSPVGTSTGDTGGAPVGENVGFIDASVPSASHRNWRKGIEQRSENRNPQKDSAATGITCCAATSRKRRMWRRLACMFDDMIVCRVQFRGFMLLSNYRFEFFFSEETLGTCPSWVWNSKNERSCSCTLCPSVQRSTTWRRCSRTRFSVSL